MNRQGAISFGAAAVIGSGFTLLVDRSKMQDPKQRNAMLGKAAWAIGATVMAGAGSAAIRDVNLAMKSLNRGIDLPSNKRLIELVGSTADQLRSMSRSDQDATFKRAALRDFALLNSHDELVKVGSFAFPGLGIGVGGTLIAGIAASS